VKVIVAGSRSWTDEASIHRSLEGTHALFSFTEVVSGGCKGPDTFGENWARSKGIPVKVFPADWAKHGRAAGPIRNGEMADYADALIVFWDGYSRGTMNMLEHARKQGLAFTIHRTDGTMYGNGWARPADREGK
jgi:hypothetical protein